MWSPERMSTRGLLGADRVDVLEDRIGSALVPALGDALHGREDLDELAEFTGHHRAPALADVAVERERLVLGEDVDVAQIGVDAVGEGDVDDAVLSGEGDGGLARSRVRGKSRSPAPPASSTPRVSLISPYLESEVRPSLRQYQSRSNATPANWERTESLHAQVSPVQE